MQTIKKLLCIGITIAFLLTTDALSLNFSGSIETSLRYEPESEWEIAYTEFELDTKITGTIGDRLTVLVEPRLTNYPIKKEVFLTDLQSRSKADPINLELGEAYGEIKGFILKSLDVKLGRIRVAWGTADKFNPTDNLNPDDLSDPLDFGEKMPSLGASATLYIKETSKIQLVWLPLFSPAVLPPLTEELQKAMASQFELEPDTGSEFLDATLSKLIEQEQFDITKVNQLSNIPEPKLANSVVGVKIATMIFDFDCSASYVYGFDDIGTPELIEIKMDEKLTPTVSAYMGYPRVHIIGADLAGSLSWLGDIGVWVEAAYFIPEPIKVKALAHLPDYMLDIAEIAGGAIEDGALVVSEKKSSDEPYFKITAGGDYTFKNDIYINAQYVRGLTSENSSDLIHDYVVARIERPFMHETIKLGAFALWSSSDGSWGLGPSVEYYPVDGAKIEAVYFYPIGSEDSLLKQLSSALLILNAKVSF